MQNIHPAIDGLAMQIPPCKLNLQGGDFTLIVAYSDQEFPVDGTPKISF
jgi:hypothetical protein